MAASMLRARHLLSRAADLLAWPLAPLAPLPATASRQAPPRATAPPSPDPLAQLASPRASFALMHEHEPEPRRSSSPSGGAGSTRSPSHSDGGAAEQLAGPGVSDAEQPPLLRESLASRVGNLWKRLFRRRKYTTAQSHYSNTGSFVGQAQTTTTSLLGASATATAAAAAGGATGSQHNGSGFRLSMVSAWNDMSGKSAEQLLAEKALKKQIAHYSTMRVHMKRVQLCLEQEKRNKFYKELLVYLVFLVVIMCALLSLPIHFPYEQNAALRDLFFDEEFPGLSVKKTFEDVMVESELWQWVDGPLLAGFYDPPIRNSRRVGSLMLRSGKVRGELCRDMKGRNDFVLFDGEVCYPEFSAAKEDTAPFGSGSGSASATMQPYTWTDDLGFLIRSQTFNPSLLSHEMDYGRGGFAVYLPRDNATAAAALVAQLKTDFVTDGTRYLVANFAYYNPRSTIFTHVQALFEMSDTDYMETTARVKSFRLLASYRDTLDFLRDNAFVLVLCLVTVGLIVRELSDLREHGLNKYVHSLWNLLDMFQLVLLVIFLTHWVTYLVRSESLREDLHRVVLMDCSGPASDQKAAAACYVDIEPLAWSFSAITNLAAALALVSIAIIFKYLRLNSRLNLLWRTLRFAAKDLLAFVAIFFVMFVGFAIMGFLTFGSSTRQYHSISVSLTSCFQMLLGAFDYNQIYTANPAMAGVFFFSFMISIYLICVNMFIAIMSEYYSLAQNEKKDREENKRSLLGSAGSGGGGADSSDSGPKSSNNSSADSDESLMDVEYDLAKQVKNYVRGQRVFVKLPPKKDAASAFATEQLLLCGYQRVLLIDYNYLMAERRRLRSKFRSWVHTAMWCLWIKRKADPDATMEVEHKLVVDKRRRAVSTDSYADLVEFPVTYLPIASTAANTVAILKRTRRGMHIEMDDGSLTKDQITLEVLGGQHEYIPPHFKRQAAPSVLPPASATAGRNSDDDGSLEVRISEISVGGGDSDADNGGKPFFGFRHVHEGIGGPEHIRCCRVLYNGDTLLNGQEACLLPRRTWVQYFVGHVFWSYVRSLLSFKKKKKKASRLVTDADVDKLIKESFAAPGRGISCRFDELVRNFRMFIAKKVHKRNIRVANIDDRIFTEVITFLERFPSALTPLDKRELEGYKYTPQPVDTRHVRLPNSINLLSELLSQNAHEVWAVGRIQQGWRWGPQRDNDQLLHPDLVPYEDLTEQDKQYDRDTSMATLKVITALGYILEPPSTAEEFGIEFGEPALEDGGTYEPKPIPTRDVKVPGYLRSVIELLAENTHEVWAKMRMDQGWKYGPRRHDDKKEHNGLVPYMYLTHEEKQMDRNTAMQTVKVILRCGFVFNHRDQLSSSRRPRKKQSGPIKVFGRNENPEAKHVGDAVSLARGTARAKRAFMRKNSTRAFTNRTSSSIGGGGGSFRSSASFESAPERNLLSYGSSSSSFMDAEPLAPAIESPPASSRSSLGDAAVEQSNTASLATTHEERKSE
ncbi:hypothetical protein PybrP1_002285 [[Pythium] brassicae (nom. inval.)]|nr:hypothetical protein PybrP1_002285 [[Pythium] brassicae (nom. inval.)]